MAILGQGTREAVLNAFAVFCASGPSMHQSIHVNPLLRARPVLYLNLASFRAAYISRHITCCSCQCVVCGPQVVAVGDFNVAAERRDMHATYNYAESYDAHELQVGSTSQPLTCSLTARTAWAQRARACCSEPETSACLLCAIEIWSF